MNASRQPFIVSALLAGLLVLVCVLGRVGIPPYPTASEVVAIAVVGLWVIALISQLAIKLAPGASRNYLPMQVFVVAAGAVVVPSAVALITSLLVTLAVRQAVFSMHKGFRFESVFRLGFWFGLALLFYAPVAAVAVVFIPAALVVYKRSAREWTVAIAGLSIPFGLMSFAYWALGLESFPRGFWANLVMQQEWLTSLPLKGIVIGSLIVLLGISACACGLIYRKRIRTTPGRFMVSTAVLFFALAASVAIPGSSAVVVPSIGAATSLAVNYGFQGRWSAVSTAIYFLVLVSVVWSVF